MTQLLEWLAHTEAHPLIASCALHYELEFIHPFNDGNGRIGRLWQTLILSRWQPVLAFLPVETVIQSRQEAYYQQLSRADSRSDCTDFILFLLEALRDALASAIQVQPAIPIKTRAETPVETQAETRAETPVKMPGEPAVKTPELLLQLLSAEPELTLRELAIRLGKSRSAVERAAARLVSDGRLRFVGPRKGGHWQLL